MKQKRYKIFEEKHKFPLVNLFIICLLTLCSLGYIDGIRQVEYDSPLFILLVFPLLLLIIGIIFLFIDFFTEKEEVERYITVLELKNEK